eukprot:COSAG01_NODE_2401_length_7759_cov_54.707572_3_plen_559_part_00
MQPILAVSLVLLVCADRPASSFSLWGWGSGEDEENADTFPESGSAECGGERHVCDPDKILSDRVYREIAKRLQELEGLGEGSGVLQPAVRHPCGAAGNQPWQFGVALTDRLAGGPSSIQSFSEETFNRWGIGHPACNNGVLFVLSRSDRRTYLKTGRGARAALTDNHASEILASLRPRLRAGDYNGAVRSAVQRVTDEALTPGRPPLFYRVDRWLVGLPHYLWHSPVAALLAVLIALAAAGVASVAYARHRAARRKATFGQKLRALQRARASMSKRGDCRDAPCPICLEPLPPGLRFQGASSQESGAEILLCGHIYHHACIDQWLRSRSAAGQPQTCAICRAERPRIGLAAGQEHELAPPPLRDHGDDGADDHDGVARRRDASSAPARMAPRPAETDESFWARSLDSLTAAYQDVPGVTRWRLHRSRLQRRRRRQRRQCARDTDGAPTMMAPTAAAAAAAAAEQEEGQDDDGDWHSSWEAEIRAEAAERAAEAVRAARAREEASKAAELRRGRDGSRHHDDDDCSGGGWGRHDDDSDGGGSWGGGSCGDGGGGAGGDW